MSKHYILNATGQHYVIQFIADQGKDGLNAEAWFAEAEAAADDAFEREMIAVIEIRSSLSYDGRPHEITLNEQWFDARCDDEENA
jgi:hypothetical protein